MDEHDEIAEWPALQAQLLQAQGRLYQAERLLALSTPENEAACLQAVLAWQAVMDEITQMLKVGRDHP
jgi:hypothetical protein